MILFLIYDYLHLFREGSQIRASSVLLTLGTQENVLRVPLGLMVLWFFCE